jgi:uncharacterized protein YlxP (DUF503 family)
MIGVLSLQLHLPGCSSLKEKRGRLKPLLARLHRQFNISAAEMDLQDKWQDAVIACGMVNSDKVHIQRSLQAVIGWVEKNWPDVQVFEEHIELL